VSETTLVNPADESVIGTVRHTTLEEVDAAVERAVVAQRAWAAVAPVDRAITDCPREAETAKAHRG